MLHCGLPLLLQEPVPSPYVPVLQHRAVARMEGRAPVSESGPSDRRRRIICSLDHLCQLFSEDLTGTGTCRVGPGHDVVKRRKHRRVCNGHALMRSGIAPGLIESSRRGMGHRRSQRWRPPDCFLEGGGQLPQASPSASSLMDAPGLEADSASKAILAVGKSSRAAFQSSSSSRGREAS